MNVYELKPSAITFQVRNGSIRCEAWVPAEARGLVILTHGTGSYRINPEILKTIGVLYNRKIAIIAADLLTNQEASEHQYRFDTNLISQRLMMLIRYIGELPVFESISVCLLGIGTGADAVLSVATRIPNKIRAIAAVNGHQHNQSLINPVFPSNLPALVIEQETLGTPANNNLWFPAVKGNVVLKKLFRSEDTIPLEGIEEASQWLCQIISRVSYGDNVRQNYELGVHQ